MVLRVKSIGFSSKKQCFTKIEERVLESYSSDFEFLELKFDEILKDVCQVKNVKIEQCVKIYYNVK